MNGAEEAIRTKLHVMYGKRLTDAQFEEMVHKHSVGELASYLKMTTRFSRSLLNMQESGIHRGQLELLVERDTFNEVSHLRGYDRSNPLFAFYDRRLELRQITSCISFLREGRSEEFLLQVPGYLFGRTDINLDEMIKARTPQMLGDALRHSPYEKVYRRLLEENKGALPEVAVCATALEGAYFDQVLETIEKAYRGDERKVLRNLLLTQIELRNLVAAYRLKRYYHASEQDVRKNMLPHANLLRPQEMEALLQAADANEFETILDTTRLGRVVAPDDFDYIEYSVDRHRLTLNHRVFVFTTSAAVAFLCFLTMREIELCNILSVIEGVRYAIAPEEILHLIVQI